MPTAVAASQAAQLEGMIEKPSDAVLWANTLPGGRPKTAMIRNTYQSALQALEAFFGPTIFRRGVQLADDGAVLTAALDETGVLVATVRGSAPNPYLTTLELLGNFDFEVFCTCPYPGPCKHAAAVAITWIRENDRDVFDRPQETALIAHPDHADIDEQWVESLVTASHSARKSENATTRGETHWVYELQVTGDSLQTDVAPGLTAIGAAVMVRIAKQQKNGRTTVGQAYRIGNDFHSADVTRREDIDILTLLRAVTHERHGWLGQTKTEGLELDGATGGLVLKSALASERLFIGRDRQTPVTLGPPVVPTFYWRTLDQRHHLTLDADIDGPWALIRTDPAWCLELHSQTLRPIETALDPEVLEHALVAPPLNTHTAETLAHWLNTSAPPDTNALLPAPPVVLPERLEGAPQPVLMIFSPQDDPHVSTWVARPIARYDDVEIGLGEQPTAAVLRAERPSGDAVLLHRDLNAEWLHANEFLHLAEDFDLAVDTGRQDVLPVDHVPDSEDPAERFEAYRRLLAKRAELEALGWQVRVLPPVQTRAEQVHDYNASLTLDDETGDWFDLSIDLEHAGKRYNLLPLVIGWLQQGASAESVVTQAEDGTWLEVPAGVLAPIAETLTELGTPSGQDRIRLSRSRALSLDTLNEELVDDAHSLSWSGDTRILALGERLRALGTASAAHKARRPRGIRAKLRDYQLGGLAWLNLLADYQLNGILADDMGLGKTLQAITHIVSQRNQGQLEQPTLVVAPTSLLGNWRREIQQFAPKLGVRVWHGADRHDWPLESDSHEVIVTSYALALRDQELLAEHAFGLLVLDEAQAIKNPQAKVTRALKALPIEKRLCLTGTPLENHLGELWSQFDFLMPGLLGDQQRFSRHFRTPIEKHGNAERQSRLATAIRPFVLRRRKEDVATELPPKTEIVREVRMDGAQAKLYESIRVAMESRVRELLRDKGLAKSRIEMLDALLKLRQTCCHPELVKLASARKVKASAKTDLLLDMLDEMMTEGRRVLVFSQFTSMLGILENELAARGHRWVKLTGQTRKRDAAIDAFQRGDVPIFLISLKAGGTGLNLTTADTVIHYDPWWNPAVERQASDRAHRIGQTKPVFIYKLVAEGTVEQRIVAMQAAKQALADATIEHDDGATLAQLSAEDVLSLFAAED